MSLNVFKHLLPKARAWSLTISKQLRDFFEGLVPIITDFKSYMDLIWFDIFPQTTRELGKWESQFGLSAGTLTEQARRDRLAATWQAVGGQDPRYIQDTLQAAGFDVYVHEWWEPGSNPPVARAPLTYLKNPGAPVAYTCECGEPLAECGEPLALCGNPVGAAGYPLVNIILESNKAFTCLCGEPFMECGEPSAECGEFSAFILERKEYQIPTDVDRWPYFLYIGAETFPGLAQLSAARKLEFERLCLKICPNQQWLGIMVQYS